MEVLSFLMKQQGERGIVALKGLPSTCKTELAHRIGIWANCPVLCIQDFLGGGGGRAYYYEGFEADFFSPPTATDQVERHHRNAFTSLLNVADRLLSYHVCNCVVIKSSLNTPFELHQLLNLARNRFGQCRLVIIECKPRNKYLWRLRFESMISDEFCKESRSWSRPRSWKAICASDQPPSFDLNLLRRLLQGKKHTTTIWIGVDPFYELSFSPNRSSVSPFPNEFTDAIKYLLTAPNQELPSQNPCVAEYDELRRFLFDQKLRDAARKRRSQSFCEGDCVFRYWQQVPQDYEADFCGVCVGQISTKPTYTCHFCATALHKTCAERFPIAYTSHLQPTIGEFIWFFNGKLSVQDSCKACIEFSKECRSCIFQDRLKCHLAPTIFNHNSHQHFLSIQLDNTDYRCSACGYRNYSQSGRSYGCKRCAFYCDMVCSFLPLELKHEHGGHEHVMKLMYTRDGMEDEEDPCWCDFCYRDMDPELWFYSCQDCPHYVVHPHCSCGFGLRVDDPKMVKFVEQLQSQLDDCALQGIRLKPADRVV